MIARLDQTSRVTVLRFGMKVMLSMLLALVDAAGYLLGLSLWLALYAICNIIIAVYAGQRFPTKSFNHWDEVLWLSTSAMGLQLVERVLA